MVAIGNVISFTYPTRPITKAHDPNPTVLVLHNNWAGQLHCLRFSHPEMGEDKKNMIRMLISPQFQKQHKAALTRRNPLLVREFDTIIKGLGTTQFTSPQDFYHKAIRPFIKPRKWEPYRRYLPGLMTNVRTIEDFKHAPPTAEGTLAAPVIGGDPWRQYLRTIGAGRGPRFNGPAV